MATLQARALAALESYLELEPAPRAKALALLRAADPELHAAIQALLQADATPDALLKSPIEILSAFGAHATPRVETSAHDPRIGSVLGPWRIDELISAGGMGRIYRASRADGQYEQEVAIKCVLTEIDSPALAEAIRNERSTLAQLEHPNIATLLDAGIDANDHPWFAMQLVQGEQIDRWCDERQLPLQARIELFCRVCDGLAYAHHKGALHSDIKPANILVDASGRPVLLDFGLSSLATPGPPGRATQVAMTPDYTAPETAADGYSVRTDLYALGMVLCRLICGQGPRQRLTPDPQPAMEALPSAMAARGTLEAARARGFASPAELSRALAGELDDIVAGCIAFDPMRRYLSVESLQEDLRAWLAGLPTSIRAFDAGHRLRLFLRRHRIAVPATAAALLALCIGLGWAVHSQQQAQRHAQEARSMRLLFDDSLGVMAATNLGASPLLSETMLQAAEHRVRKWTSRASPGARVHGLLALAKSYAVAGDYVRAQALVRESKELDRDGNVVVLADAVQAHLFNLQARYREAISAARLGLSRVDQLEGHERDGALLALQVELARALRSTAQVKEGTQVLDRALRSAEARADAEPAHLAELLIVRGEWQGLFYRYESAERDLRRAIELAGDGAPVIADNARDALVSTLLSLQRPEEALAMAREVLANRRRMFGERHPETGKAWTRLAAVIANGQQFKPDLAPVKRGEAILLEALGPDHPAMAEALQVEGQMQARIDRRVMDGAVASARRALAIVERKSGANSPQAVNATLHLAAMLATRYDALMQYASLEHGSGAGLAKVSPQEWTEVVSLYARGVAIARGLGMAVLWPRVTLVRANMRAGDLGPENEARLKDLVTEMTAARGPLNPMTLNTRQVLAEWYASREDFAGAFAVMRALVDDTAGAPRGSELESIRMRLLGALAESLQGQGKLREARQYFMQGREISVRVYGEKHITSQAFDTQLAQLDAMLAKTGSQSRPPSSTASAR